MGQSAPKPTTRFITLEGSDGSGKSTLLERIKGEMERRRLPCHFTREPGGTAVADEIRDIILKPGRALNPRAELLLFEAARAEHVANVIRPKLARGTHVFCDRFTHSTLAYQGAGRGLNSDEVAWLNRYATTERGDAPLEPDAVIWLRIPPDAARARVAGRTAGGAEESRIDAEKLVFHQAVHAAFEKMAKDSPQQFIVLDATSHADAVFQQLLEHSTWKKLFPGDTR